MNRFSLRSEHTNALLLLVPAVGLALFLAAASSPQDLLTHTPLYVAYLTGAWACFAAGAYWARRHPSACSSKAGMTLILGTALVIRVWLLPIRPTLSTDIYRYLWDGRVLAAGHNPYVLPPTAPELASLRSPDWRHINFPEVRTPYPPVSEALFGLMAVCRPDSVLALKLALGVCELLSLWLIAALLRHLKRPRSDLLLIAWSPLAITETWLHGHNDCLGVTLLLAGLLALARRAEPPLEAAPAWDRTRGSSAWRTGLWLGLAAMGKLHALLAFPILLPRIGWRGLLMTLVVIAACIVPFLGAGPHLMGGAQEMLNWSVNGSLYPLLLMGCRNAGVDARAVRPLSGVLLILGLILLARRPSGELSSSPGIYRRVGYALLLGYLLSPVLQPWYLVWIAPFVALAPTASFFVFTGTVTLWYLGGAMPAISYVPVYVCLAAEGWQAWRGRGTAATS